MQAVAVPRKAPKIRVFQKDELEDFKSQDLICNFADLSECNAPAGYKCDKDENCIVFYNVAINEKSGFPQVQEAIKIDKDLHVKLQFCCNSVPLPQWFVKGRTVQLSSFSMLDNFPPYLQSFKGKQNQLLIEMGNQQHYKAKARVPFSAELIRFALLLRYTSAQAYRLLQENFPLPSFSLLQKLRKGNLNAMKVCTYLHKNGKLSNNITVMVNEMYLRKCVQYSASKFIGSDKTGEFCKGIIVFMIRDLSTLCQWLLKVVHVLLFL